MHFQFVQRVRVCVCVCTCKFLLFFLLTFLFDPFFVHADVLQETQKELDENLWPVEVCNYKSARFVTRLCLYILSQVLRKFMKKRTKIHRRILDLLFRCQISKSYMSNCFVKRFFITFHSRDLCFLLCRSSLIYIHVCVCVVRISVCRAQTSISHIFT